MEYFEKVDFNRCFFVRNDDQIFKAAVMLSRFPEISQVTQEILFFANKKIIKDNMNYLAYTEMFNETILYARNWLLELDLLKDEFDWEFHRSKLATRFNLMQPIESKDNLLQHMEKNGHKREGIIIYNSMVSWNNAIYYGRNDKYKDNSNSKKWELWNILVKYKNDKIDQISGDKSHLKELKEVIKYRKEDKFFSDQHATLSNENLAQIDKLENALSTIILKEELTKEIPIISSIKKIFKL